MFEFLRRLFHAKPVEIEMEFELEDPAPSIIYLDEDGNVELEVLLICSCDNQVDMLKMDDSFEPPIPHFECNHCDRPCRVDHCASCRSYAKNTFDRFRK
jgi:hypothetical protein